MKYRAQKEMKNPKAVTTQAVTMKNKKSAIQGTYSTGGTKMFEVGKAE